MAVNLNYDETQSVYGIVLDIMRQMHAGTVDPADPDVLKAIEMGEVDEARVVAMENAFEDFSLGVQQACEYASEKLSILEAAYTPKQS